MSRAESEPRPRTRSVTTPSFGSARGGGMDDTELGGPIPLVAIGPSWPVPGRPAPIALAIGPPE